MDTISILIADDHPLVLAGLAALIAATPGLALLGQASNGREALAQYRQARPDVVLIDLNMPELGGLACIEQIRRHDPDARIVILTTYEGEEDVYRGLQAGAMAYLLKNSSLEQLCACVKAVAAGQPMLPAAVAARLAARRHNGKLSRRELEILAHLATGMSNKMIARSAGIEVGTVKFHVNNILSKLNAASRTEAAMLATRRGLLHPY